MLLELVIRGIAIGLIYALMGAGLMLLHGIMRIINFAHGSFYMIGGYVAYYIISVYGVPFVLGIPLTMVVIFLLGALVEKLLLSPIHTQNIEKPMDYTVIMTFALFLFFRQAASLVFGPFYRKPPDYIPFDIYILGVKLSGTMVLAGVLSAVLIAALSLFLRKTWRGRSWRAITQSNKGAKINGVNINKESWIACGLACSLAGAAGALVAPIFLVSPEAGSLPLAKSYEVLAIGGLGSITGSLVAGSILGLGETLAAAYIFSEYRDAIGFLIMAMFLLFRPQGLFGEKV
jgi:branched-chain amino acid transport system permease protein